MSNQYEPVWIESVIRMSDVLLASPYGSLSYSRAEARIAEIEAAVTAKFGDDGLEDFVSHAAFVAAERRNRKNLRQ